MNNESSLFRAKPLAVGLCSRHVAVLRTTEAPNRASSMPMAPGNSAASCRPGATAVADHCAAAELPRVTRREGGYGASLGDFAQPDCRQSTADGLGESWVPDDDRTFVPTTVQGLLGTDIGSPSALGCRCGCFSFLGISRLLLLPRSVSLFPSLAWHAPCDSVAGEQDCLRVPPVLGADALLLMSRRVGARGLGGRGLLQVAETDRGECARRLQETADRRGGTMWTHAPVRPE